MGRFVRLVLTLSISGLAAGRYGLTLELDTIDLSLPAVHVGQPEVGQPLAEP